MEKLIEVDELIKQAKKKGIDFGKGNPYNRLRYYTKLGLLPHMERKKANDGKITGHYPADTLERLEYIEELKAKGYSNEQISEELEKKDKVKGVTTFLKSPESRVKIVTYASFIILLLILLVELGIFPIGKSKTEFIEQPTLVTETPQIIDAGSGFIATNQNRVFVKTEQIAGNSKINITFNSDYFPATRYWADEIIPGRGFYVQLDSQVTQDAIFDWWVSN